MEFQSSRSLQRDYLSKDLTQRPLPAIIHALDLSLFLYSFVVERKKDIVGNKGGLLEKLPRYSGLVDGTIGKRMFSLRFQWGGGGGGGNSTKKVHCYLALRKGL